MKRALQRERSDHGGEDERAAAPTPMLDAATRGRLAHVAAGARDRGTRLFARFGEGLFRVERLAPRVGVALRLPFGFGAPALRLDQGLVARDAFERRARGVAIGLGGLARIALERGLGGDAIARSALGGALRPLVLAMQLRFPPGLARGIARARRRGGFGRLALACEREQARLRVRPFLGHRGGARFGLHAMPCGRERLAFGLFALGRAA